MGVGSLVFTVYFLLKFGKDSDLYVRVLVAKTSGGGEWKMAARDGGSVTFYDPHSDTTRTWPINELSTIDIDYPGAGWPRFMQKKIRLAVLNEGDIEPLLNRSPHNTKVASPDIVAMLTKLAAESQALKDTIAPYLDGIKTGPTRAMISNPANLGNLMQTMVLKALASVSNELMESLKMITTKLTNFAGINANYIYIGLVLILILGGYQVYQISVIAPQLEQAASVASQIEEIHKALGIK